MKAFGAIAFAFIIAAGGVLAQNPAERVISGGMLNGRATSFPNPEYPESARQEHIGGIVGVNIIVDELGNVISAVAEVNDQHEVRNAAGRKLAPVPVDPRLREAAEIAARQATFAPMFLGGQPAKLKGKLLYNFVADNSDQPPRIGKIFGPSVSAKALSLPQPEYPQSLVGLNVSGPVTVHVVVDTEGNVISADATSGNPLLRASAAAAARKAKFTPDLLAGQPVRFEGVVTYVFAAPTAKPQ